jgi:hypothetical protein
MLKVDILGFATFLSKTFRPPPAAALVPFLLSIFVELTAENQERFIRDRVEQNVALEMEDEFRDADQILRAALHAQGRLRLYISFSLTSISALLLAIDKYLTLCGLIFSLTIGLLSWILVREPDPNDWRDFELPLIDRTAVAVIIYNAVVVSVTSLYFAFLPPCPLC